VPATLADDPAAEFELVSQEPDLAHVLPKLNKLENKRFLMDDFADPNSVTERARIRKTVRPSVHFELVPAAAWQGVQTLNSKLNFGIDYEIPRRVISMGEGGLKELKVETHPKVIHFFCMTKREQKLADSKCCTFSFSSGQPILCVVEEVQQSLFGSDLSYAASRFLYSATKPDSFESGDWTEWTLPENSALCLKDLSFLEDETYMLVELKMSDDVPWPRETDSSTQEKAAVVCKVKKGLTNLGNTCFMASALQCLLHNPSLKEYFLSGKYISEINEDNPLGKKGELARSYAKILQEIFRSETNPVRPSDLKYCISRFNPMFSGYQQQDSQELMAFLMDGLHEDLNRVIKKPYTEPVEGDDTRKDAELAEEAWQVHLQRNKSIIVDLMQSQYKSRLSCPKCNKVSVTFDPYMYLSVPLPNRTEQQAILVSCTLMDKPGIFEIGVAIPKQPKNFDEIADAVKAELTRLELWKQPNIDDVRDETEFVIFNGAGAPNSDGVVDDSAIEVQNSGSSSLMKIRSSKRIIAVEIPKRETALNSDWDAVSAAKKSRIEAGSTWGKIKSDDQKATTIVICRRAIVKPADPYPADSEREQEKEKVSFKLGSSKFYQNKEEEDTFEIFAMPMIIDVRGDTSVESYRQDVYDRAAKLGIDAQGAQPKLCVGVDMKIRQSFDDDVEGKIMKELLPGVCSYVLADFPAETTVAAANRSDSWDDLPEKLNRNVSLADCFELWAQEETLGQDDMWYCGSCKDHVQATKKLDLWSLPQYFTIHLKRFQYSRLSYTRSSKIDALIDFPVEELLDMSPFLSESAIEFAKEKGHSLKYQLFGVSNHSGSLAYGHYTAYVRDTEEDAEAGVWHDYNDSFVQKIREPENTVCSDNAYLLFYRRIDPEDEARLVKPAEDRKEQTPRVHQDHDGEDADGMKQVSFGPVNSPANRPVD